MVKRLFVVLFLLFIVIISATAQNAWINELHYDNAGTDTGEFVEVVLENPGSYTLSDFTVDLYNGSDGEIYASETLNNFTPGSTIGDYTIYYWEYSGIQNGAPDGLALSYQGTVITGQFLSYEGTFTATDGPAIGFTSVDIGVSEINSTPVGESLQLSGTGSQYSDFTWQFPDSETSGAINNNQSLIGVSMSSDIIKKSGWTEPQDIDYTLYLATSGLNTSNSVETGSFTIRDGGGANDSDGVATTLTDITFDIDQYENIQAIAIFDGTTNVSEITTVNNTLSFSGLTLQAPDNSEKDFTVRLSFKTTVTDNDKLQFTITSATSSGSGFADTDAGGAQTDNTGNSNKIVVVADRLAINTPGSVLVSYNFTVSVTAVDENNNTDLDQASSVTLVKYSGAGNLSSGSGLTQNLSTGIYQWNDVQYDAVGVFRVEAQSAGLTNVISNNITASSGAYTDLIISEIADPEDISNAKFVELYNAGSSTIDFSSQSWYLTREANGGTLISDVQVGPTASLAPGETWVLAYNNTNGLFLSTYGFSPDQESSIPSGNGNDSYFLYYGGDHTSGTLIDTYGEWGVNGTGTAWEYKDSKATRKKHIASPNSIWTASEWVIIPATANEMTPKWHNKDLTWNGASGNWNTHTNWTDGGNGATYPPDAGCDLTIPNLANDPDISGRASCNNMTIESGAVVTVGTTCFLVTGSAITNSTGVSGLIVESNATGDGMLLLGTGTTQATVQRYLSDDMAHFISAPITDATADKLFQNHNPEVYLYEYHEDDELYHYLVPTTTPMPVGKGFYTWVDNAPSDHIIASFDGTLMSSSLILNSSSTPSLQYTDNSHGWNLVGNPYPVPLDWTKGSWDTTSVEGTVYIWDPDENTTEYPDGSWVWRNSQGAGTSGFDAIPGGQAFFIRTKSTAASLTIPADARTVHVDQPYYKAPREDEEDTIPAYPADYIIVKATNEQDTDEVWISFNEQGTEGFDNGWDASKMFNSYNTISVYVPKETRDQCLEHLPALVPDEEQIVAVDFETTVDGEHTLVLDMMHMPEVVDITLEDLKYNQMQSMRNDSVYHFVAFAGDDPGRFRIHFNKTTTATVFPELDPVTKPPVHIYAYEKTIYIKKEDMHTAGSVLIYDLYGREVLTQPLEQSKLMKIPLRMSNTYLIVKVISNSKVTTSKVFIR